MHRNLELDARAATRANRWRRPVRLAAVLALALACHDDNRTPTAVPAPGTFMNAASISSSNFQQCANGDNGGEVCVYINGVLNDTKSAYHEGEVIAERFVIPGLTKGTTYKLVFDWGWEKAVNPGHMNYDFLAGWNSTLGVLANPCGSPLGNNSADIRAICNIDNTVKGGYTLRTAEIPDTIFTKYAPLGLSQELAAAITRFKTRYGSDAVRFDLYGGTFGAAQTFVPVTYNVSGDNVTGRFAVRFVADSSTVMLLWGGHFASGRDYATATWDADKNAATPETTGNLSGAAGQSGAPFQFTQQYLKNETTGDSTGIGALSNNVMGSVVTAVPKAKIELSPLTATNAVGDAHTVTVTVSEAEDVSDPYVPAAGETVTYSLTGSNGATPVLDAATSTCDDQTTNASGQCTIVFTSQTAGTVTIHAQSNVAVGGTTILASSGTGGDNSGDALKYFVSGSLAWVKVDGGNSNAYLGGAVFTVCGPSYPTCTDVTDDVTPDADTTDGKFLLNGLKLGEYTVTEKTPPAGYNKLTGTQTDTLTIAAPNQTIGTAFDNRAPNAYITITPQNDTNSVNQSHTFTAKVVAIRNGAASSTIYPITITVSPTPSTPGTTQCGSQVADTLTCTLTINSSSAGTFTANASDSVRIGTVLLKRDTDAGTTDPAGPGGSGPATKLYVAGSLFWTKVDGGNSNALLGGATFKVCGPSYPSPTCVTVVDDAAPDADTTDGKFRLNGLDLGTYTVEETVPPTGYNKLTGQQQATLTEAAPSDTIPLAFDNRAPNAFITITPQVDTNNVTEQHTFTAKVTAIPNGGPTPVISAIKITVSPTPDSLGTVSCAAQADTTRTCTLTIKSNTAGTFSANALDTVTVGAVTLVRATNGTSGPGGSGAATKVYLAPHLTLIKKPDSTNVGWTVQPGDSARFTIKVINDGLGSALNTKLRDTLPNSGLTWVESNAKCDITTISVSSTNRQRLDCNIGTMAPNDTFTVVVAAKVPLDYVLNPPSPAGTSIEIDGNLRDGAAAGADWNSLPDSTFSCLTPKGCDIDLATGSGDNSFGQGTKEDTPVPTVVTGSIPNNKSDLLRFYVAAQRFDTTNYLYLAWERVQAPNGTTNMDFELNQDTTLSANGVTPKRTAGDILIAYDLAKGGTVPVLSFHRWVTLASAGGKTAAQMCEAANAFPCWGKADTLSTDPTKDVRGAINADTTTDTAWDPDKVLDALTFGEASINLQKSGIFQSGVCLSFGKAYLKSRSSDSFSSEIKDFIAPIPINVTNCSDKLLRNLAWAWASNFKPTATDTLGTPISDGGLIKVGAPTASIWRVDSPTSERLAFAETGSEGSRYLLRRRRAL